MSNDPNAIKVAPELLDYIRLNSLTEHPAQVQLRDETATHEKAAMQIGPEQGKFMQMLVKLTGAKRCIEVGVFTGYSALSVALALPEDGEIKAFDISEEWTSMGRKYWESAGVSKKIDLRLQPATEGLAELIEAGQAGQYDMAFIDADKVNYRHYYEACLQLIRPNGLILVDNTLWEGKVIDETVVDPDTVAIRNLNEHMRNDDRVEVCQVPIRDGVTMVRKR